MPLRIYRPVIARARANRLDVDSGAKVREGLSTVTRGTLFLLIATLCLVGLNFASRVLVVRSISPSDWNAFSFGLTLVTILSAFGTLGLPNAVARGIPYASSDAERRTIVRGTLLIGSGSAAVAAVLLYVFAPTIGSALGSPAITVALEFFPIALGASIVSGLTVSIFQGYEDVTPNAVFSQIVNPALFVVFLLIALVVPPNGITYTESLIAYTLANVVTLALVLIYAWRRLPRRLPRGPQAPEALGRLLRFAAPLFVVGVMTSITGYGDTLILGIYHESEIGVYSNSLTLARLVQIGISASSFIFLPVASKFLRQDDPRSIRITYATVTKWMTLVSLPLFALFFFLPGESLGFVYGPSYASVVLPLQIVVVGAFFTTLLGPSTTAQVVYGQTRLLAYNAVAAGALDFALSFALIPTYGYVGSAIAWASANVAFFLLSLGELILLSEVHPFRRHFVIPVVVTTIPIGALFALVHWNVSGLLLVPLGLGIAVLFVVLVLVTRSIDDGDRLLLEAIERMAGRPLPLLRRLGRLALRTPH
ncbi:MAG TPA: flippase [Thermoplasmata archaeon]|nr:flippase [Thermoplasmata archaeon]